MYSLISITSWCVVDPGGYRSQSLHSIMKETGVQSIEFISRRTRCSDSQACKLFTTPLSYCLGASSQYGHKSIGVMHELLPSQAVPLNMSAAGW